MASNGTFSGVEIGDYCWLIPVTSMPDTVIYIPRAQGIRQRDMGGGEQLLTVKAWVVKDTNVLLAQYLEALGRNFGTGLASLVIDSATYTNSKLVNIVPEDRYRGAMVDYFTCVFRKSAATQ